MKSWYGYFTAIIDGQTNDSAGKQVEEIKLSPHTPRHVYTLPIHVPCLMKY